jgi:hypothetical protein
VEVDIGIVKATLRKWEIQEGRVFNFNNKKTRIFYFWEVIKKRKNSFGKNRKGKLKRKHF